MATTANYNFGPLSFPRTVSANAATRLPCSADAAWKVVGDFGGTVLTRGMIDKIDVEGDGIGMVRILHMGGNACVREALVERSETERYYIYKVVDAGPVNVAQQIGMGQITPAGPNECILSWSTMANPVDGKADELAAMLNGIVSMACTNARDYFANQ